MSPKKKESITEIPGNRMTLIERIEAKTSAFPLTEFAAMTGIGYQTAWDMVKTGRLPAIRIGSAWRIDPVIAANWLRERSTA